MRIAVVGAGISGLLAAWLLRREHEVVVLEAGGHAGGHTRTITVDDDGAPLPVDTGFIVYNERNGLEYAGSDDPRVLFAQRRNLLRPRFWGMLRDLRRFYREAPLALGTLPASTTVGQWLGERGYGRAFVEQHIVPMGGAIWSSGRQGLREFPAEHFLRFLHNHGMLQSKDRPRWRTVEGGSHQYVRALLRGWEEQLRLNTPVHAIRRDGEERALLSPFRFCRNDISLHRDRRLLPRRRRAGCAGPTTCPAAPARSTRPPGTPARSSAGRGRAARYGC